MDNRRYGRRPISLNVNYCQPSSPYECENTRIYYIFKEESRVQSATVHLSFTVISLRNHWLNPYILHTHSTIKYLVNFRVGTIS